MSDDRDKEGQPQGFKVSDRRKRYEEPSESAPEPAPAPAPETESRPVEPPLAAEAAGVAAPEAAQQLGGEDLDAGAALPGPADFVQLVGKLYQEGLAFMGLFDDPQAGPSMANFPVASWHIDILGVLQEKTKGNLSAEEAKLVADAIANLKLTFVRASGTIKH